ncbi:MULTISPECIES: MaoC/PaaZ C-terminal domain-containing protein [Gordonia]|uniref:MaoC/PaaZ C-terminal domain-containing protein n=1 Tax=Gordonia amicalis TaxID=89053 RepID=A0ABU4DDL6_9ACTN|nr:MULTISPECIES: MaoC/PaaZ C-terminal domain-containing protein [Gordonia]ATD72293.1 acyl dehydratase [Gordonia sp. 1D]MCR8895991.1 MaoC/PaaZ C-terminal domain-containing protein [Gordonia sp. GONU]MCZ4651548.1 MaoC/PaaZ C-terminal domain-containing protein [Gordonia amicalis]MDJ0452581.1 MaoC/PaaZ C-terminal domain-containing protein [Gordonia amicalis]MDV6307845.1 MaoC/PaaZ C-terminal domain-containing protein [Gordonia amicalis]
MSVDTSTPTAQPVVGDTREAILVEDLSRTQIVQYAGASGDYNPLHTDELFAREVAGVPTVFAHGMLTMGMTGRLVTDWFGAAAVEDYSARFVAQVWPGDTLVGRATVTEVEAIERTETTRVQLVLETTNQRDETVLKGTATVLLDREVDLMPTDGNER